METGAAVLFCRCSASSLLWRIWSWFKSGMGLIGVATGAACADSAAAQSRRGRYRVIWNGLSWQETVSIRNETARVCCAVTDGNSGNCLKLCKKEARPTGRSRRVKQRLILQRCKELPIPKLAGRIIGKVCRGCNRFSVN